MLTRFFLTIWLSLVPLTLAALCPGTDLRQSLTAAERQALDRAVAATPYAQGNHWRATKDGQVLHIIGTMHVYDWRLDGVRDRLADTIRGADLILLEATAEDLARLEAETQTNPELLYRTEGPTLPELMSDAQWERLSQAASERGIPSVLASKMQPWFLSLLMSIPACAMQEITQGIEGLDRMIMGLAEAEAIPTQSLENYDTVFRVFGAYPLEEQVDLLIMSLLPEDVVEDALFTLKESYFEEVPAEIWHMTRLIAERHVDLPPDALTEVFAEFEELLLTRRNRAWMAPILASEAQTVVIAVGAAHLMGETGVLQLLEAEGFALSRAPF